MNDKTKLRKWMLTIGTLFTAIGIGLLFVEEINALVSFISVIIGISFYVASNFYRTKKPTRE